MWKLNEKNGVKYYTISSFEETGLVRHGFSTREGGVSGGCYSSMNLRFNCADTRENVINNYKIISGTLGMDFNRLVLSKQVHETNVHIASEIDAGNGILRENEFKSADALVTDKADLPLVTLFADCTPVLFLDPVKKVIASAHSGWRGTYGMISKKVVEVMADRYGSDRRDILTAIGPSIQECHFEVGDDVAGMFIERFGADTAVLYGERYHVNMQRAIKKQLLDAGIDEKNIDDCGICTYCSSDFLFSHRKTNGKRGNMGAFIEII